MSDESNSWRLGKRPGLDGIRGIAVILVIVGHTLLHGFDREPGQVADVGVAVFFTLSGFLITALLVQERRASGTVSLSRFFARRARRLLPALIAMLLVVAALAISIEYMPVADVGDFLGSLLYFQNWRLAGGWDSEALAHMWSLSIEEQFYLVWPLVFLVLARFSDQVLISFTVLSILGSVALRVVLSESGVPWQRIYVGTDTRADNLLIGCLAALLLCRTRHRTARPLLALAALSIAVAAGFVASRVWLPFVVALATATALWLVAQPGGAGVLQGALLRWAGLRSYALYLWHLPLLWIFSPMESVAGSVVAPIALTVALAELSWRLVEQPFLMQRGQLCRTPLEPSPRTRTGGEDERDDRLRYVRGAGSGLP